MPSNFSAYLDVVRFLAAMVVFLGHASGIPWTAGFLMLHEVWRLNLVPGINGAFWSLSYEAFYYLMFGIIFYGRQTQKWLAVGLLLLLSGPVIAALFPVWGMGFLAYRLCKARTF